MLIEFPMDKIYFQKAIDEIYELKIKGITPVIAHPERYVDFINNPEEIKTVKRAEAVTAAAFFSTGCL